MTDSRRGTLRSVGLSALLVVVVLVPRLPGLRSFVAVDEPAWLTRGGNFYYALAQREFERTVYEYHPGVTTMWLVTFGYLVYFPEYRGLGQGYFNVDKQDFDPFLMEHGQSPLMLLYYARLFQVALHLRCSQKLLDSFRFIESFVNAEPNFRSKF